MSPPRTNSSTSSALRILSRRPGLTLAGLALAGTWLGFRHISSRRRDNELAQKNSAVPNLHVTVDRSGGGI
ncbi:hypothetical protein VTK56DRAFT_3972 [Thermocarpiscus australiensis]